MLVPKLLIKVPVGKLRFEGLSRASWKADRAFWSTLGGKLRDELLMCCVFVAKDLSANILIVSFSFQIGN